MGHGAPCRIGCGRRVIQEPWAANLGRSRLLAGSRSFSTPTSAETRTGRRALAGAGLEPRSSTPGLPIGSPRPRCKSSGRPPTADAVSKNRVIASVRSLRASSIEAPSLVMSRSGHNATKLSSSRSMIAVKRCAHGLRAKLHKREHLRNMRVVVPMPIPGPAGAGIQFPPRAVELLKPRTVDAPHVPVAGRQRAPIGKVA